VGVVQNNGTLESLLSWITILFLLSSTLQGGDKDIDNDTTEILTTRVTAPSGSYTEEQASYNTVGCALGLTCV